MKCRGFSKTSKTVLRISQQPNIAQRPFCIQNEREYIFYDLKERLLLWLLCELRHKSNNEAVFWKIVKDTLLWACGKHPFLGPTSHFLLKKDWLCLNRRYVKFQQPIYIESPQKMIFNYSEGGGRGKRNLCHIFSHSHIVRDDKSQSQICYDNITTNNNID